MANIELEQYIIKEIKNAVNDLRNGESRKKVNIPHALISIKFTFEDGGERNRIIEI